MQYSECLLKWAVSVINHLDRYCYLLKVCASKLFQRYCTSEICGKVAQKLCYIKRVFAVSNCNEEPPSV